MSLLGEIGNKLRTNSTRVHKTKKRFRNTNPQGKSVSFNRRTVMAKKASKLPKKYIHKSQSKMKRLIAIKLTVGNNPIR